MALAFFQSTTDGVTISLDCVESVSRSRSATATKNPTESKKTYTDHYVVDPLTASYRGIITNLNKLNNPSQYTLGTKNNPYTSAEFVDLVERSLLSKTPFTFYLSNDDGENLTIPNCLITSFNIVKDTGMGNAWRVDFSIQEILIVDKAQATKVKLPSADYSNQSGGKDGVDKKGDKATKDLDKNTVANILLGGVVEGVSSLGDILVEPAPSPPTQ